LLKYIPHLRFFRRLQRFEADSTDSEIPTNKNVKKRHVDVPVIPLIFSNNEKSIPPPAETAHSVEPYAATENTVSPGNSSASCELSDVDKSSQPCQDVDDDDPVL
jgi:hypothetical protein